MLLPQRHLLWRTRTWRWARRSLGMCDDSITWDALQLSRGRNSKWYSFTCKKWEIYTAYLRIFYHFMPNCWTLNLILKSVLSRWWIVCPLVSHVHKGTVPSSKWVCLCLPRNFIKSPSLTTFLGLYSSGTWSKVRNAVAMLLTLKSLSLWNTPLM